MADRQLIFMTACDIGDGLITIDEVGIGIFRIDKSDMTTHLLERLENMGTQRHVYRAIEQFGNEIFFFPAFLTLDIPILVYHMDSHYTEHLNLREINQNVGGRYGATYRAGDCIWLFPEELDKHLVRFYLDSRRIEIVPEWNEATKNIIVNDADTFVKVSNVIEIQDELYHAIKGTNFILQINKKNQQVVCHEIPTEKKFFIRLDYDGERFWIAESNNQGIISWNPTTQESQYYPISSSDESIPQRDMWGKWISHILCGKKYLWIVPQRDGKLLKMNYENGNFEWIEIFPHKFCVQKEKGSIIGMIKKNGNIANLYPHRSKLVIYLYFDNDVLLEKYEKILLPDEWTDVELTEYQRCHELETNRIAYNTYLDCLLQKAEADDRRMAACTNGENIWWNIKN